ncbi:MAG: PIG-L family deacetylase [Candidatus Tectomicrobia bacterium]|nr:PIG-L family deacetylase [Candidatus Tectomicrobia bacterium]
MPPSHRLLLVKAHPDDESYGHAGLILRCRQRRIPVALVCATRGEAGITPGMLPAGEEAGALRLRELAAARQVLGLQRVEVIGVPDGQSERWDLPLVRNHVARAMRAFRPTVVATFGPEGVTGHPDHITIGRVATEVFFELRAQWHTEHTLADGSLGRLYHVAVPKEFERRRPGELRGRGDITTILDVSDLWEQKRDALRCHASQTRHVDLEDPALREALSREHLVRVFPPPPAGLRETDLFSESDLSLIT